MVHRLNYHMLYHPASTYLFFHEAGSTSLYTHHSSIPAHRLRHSPPWFLSATRISRCLSSQVLEFFTFVVSASFSVLSTSSSLSSYPPHLFFKMARASESHLTCPIRNPAQPSLPNLPSEVRNEILQALLHSSSWPQDPSRFCTPWSCPAQRVPHLKYPPDPPETFSQPDPSNPPRGPRQLLARIP